MTFSRMALNITSVTFSGKINIWFHFQDLNNWNCNISSLQALALSPRSETSDGRVSVVYCVFMLGKAALICIVWWWLSECTLICMVWWWSSRCTVMCMVWWWTSKWTVMCMVWWWSSRCTWWWSHKCTVICMVWWWSSRCTVVYVV